MVEDVLEPAVSLVQQIKNLEATVNDLGEELLHVRKQHNETFEELQRLRTEIFG